jgi:stage III sporulation protein AB
MRSKGGGLMVKLLGAVLVVGSSGVIGNVVASGFSERPRQLSELISGFTLLETEISYAKTPLSEALMRARGQKCSVAGRIFETASHIIASGDQSPGQAWETAVRCTYPVSALTSEDRDALLAFGALSKLYIIYPIIRVSTGICKIQKFTMSSQANLSLEKLQ